jgi:hypothetical protein
MSSERRGDADSTRTAKISYDDSGQPIGLAIFLSSAQLVEMGIHPDRTDAVDYCVADGELILTQADEEQSRQ